MNETVTIRPQELLPLLLQIFFLVSSNILRCGASSLTSLPPKGNRSVISGPMSCVQREREVLLRFKQGLTDFDGVLASWGIAEEPDCCNWRGVGCGDGTGHVTALQLRGGGWPSDYKPCFGGEINSALLELEHLDYLDLSGNNFHTFPEFLGSLRNLRYLNLSDNWYDTSNLEWLSHLSSLKHLDLSRTHFTQATNWFSIIGNLPSLVELKLSDCSLPRINTQLIKYRSKYLRVIDLSLNYLPSSSIYPWLFNSSFKYLTHIDLSSNRLEGAIPEEFGTFTLLEHLDLSNNDFQGGIPNSFANLSNLRSLLLSWNNLSEQLPLLFNKLPGNGNSLQTLKLDYNQLTGPLPDFTQRNYSGLVIVDLSQNRITGSLPDLSGSPSLESFNASWNLMRGKVSEDHFRNLSKLSSLDLTSNNNLSFEFSSEWVPPFQLREVKLSSVKLGPSFPKWIRTQKNMEYIDISLAGISDTVPNWFWDLTTRVSYLNLSYNQIEGLVPDQLLISGNNLVIDLGSNNFSGRIPAFPPRTIVLNLSKNMFSGSISLLCDLGDTLLDYLDLSYNVLSGEIPDCWIRMKFLRVLNLQSNQFSGKIPMSIQSLTSITMLNMHGNRLTGELPSFLNNLNTLVLLDFGDNKLSGKIPDLVGKNSWNLLIICLGSNKFNGTIPLSFCYPSEIQILDLSVNNLSGTIPGCLENLHGMRESTTLSSAIGVFIRQSGYSYYVFHALVRWKGRVSEYSNTLGLVKSLDLSSNKLSGEIPGSITSLKSLVGLNLSGNNLTGHIPTDIGC